MPYPYQQSNQYIVPPGSSSAFPQGLVYNPYVAPLVVQGIEGLANKNATPIQRWAPFIEAAAALGGGLEFGPAGAIAGEQASALLLSLFGTFFGGSSSPTIPPSYAAERSALLARERRAGLIPPRMHHHA